MFVGLVVAGCGGGAATPAQPAAPATEPSPYAVETIDLDVRDADNLMVACVAEDHCFVSLGEGGCWELHGDAPPVSIFLMEPSDCLGLVAVDDVVVVFMAVGSSRVAALRIGAGVRSVPVELAVPGDQTTPSFSFIARAPDGIIWAGLRYLDGGDMRPWGVALIDLDLGQIAYHHATGDRAERERGVLPIPVDTVDVAFLGDTEVVLATSDGLAIFNPESGEIRVFNEGSEARVALRSELLRDVEASAGGMVFLAHGAGIEMYDGESVTFLRDLPPAANDISVTPDGKLWIATDEGLAVYHGTTVEPVALNPRGGREVVDIVVDRQDRVWARTPDQLVRVTPSAPPRP